MSSLPKIKPCPRCGSADEVGVSIYEGGGVYVECTMECGYRGPASTSKLWAVRNHNAAAISKEPSA